MGHPIEDQPNDRSEALKWLIPIAERGKPRQQNNMGVLYAEGLGVPQDYVQAHMWFNLAAAIGDEVAKKNRDAVSSKMTPAQIAEAQKLAREWLAAHPN
jgi:uncharacterized protein